MDTAGAVIAKATVELRTNDGYAIRTNTDATGTFAIDLSKRPRSSGARPATPKESTLIVSAPGFRTIRLMLSPQIGDRSIEVRLEPALLIARIEVNAESEETSATSTNTTSLNERTISNSGALTLDDTLRQVPGFSLFRRSGSLTANPTSQGVSLRGVGANGASRAIVLLDGIPLNTPFGGWVYWNRVPRASIQSVEVTSGGASDVYGSGALGGVINIKSRTEEQSFVSAETSVGNEATAAGSAVAGMRFGRWGVLGSIQALRTDGYVLVPKDQRGRVDTQAGTAAVGGSLTFSRTLRREGRAFIRLNSFAESRRNGTPIQVNDTRIWSVDAGLDTSNAKMGVVSARLYGSGEMFNQNFTAIALDRNSESLTNRQRNPGQQLGAVFQWRRGLARRHAIVAGFEGRDVRGHSAEATFSAARLTANVDAGGRQRAFAAFGQDSVRAREWLLTFGGRVDQWLNREGFSNRVPAAGAASLVDFTPRSETAFSPRLSVSRRFEGGIRLAASFYRAFRAPTLNELYRNFRVGNVVTNANADLRAERLTGGEGGITFQKFAERLTVRGNIFWSRINGPVANVTLAVTPTLITRQRQNLGAIRARGGELNAAIRITNSWNFSAEYLLTDSTILRFPANRTLEGLLVPQIPRHQLNFQTSYNRGRWNAGAQARFVSRQFDDDQNALPLRSYFTLDAELSRTITSQFTLFFAAQNLTGARYEVSRTPVLTVGPPVLLRIGGRINFP